METIECIKTRRSVRQYLDKPVPKEIIEELADCGRLAPTARNKQPWEFIAVTGKETLKEISELATYGKFIKDAALCIIVCGDKSNKHLVEDGCIAAENILLAAHAKGLGGCWVAGWQREYNPELMKLLGIPEAMEIVAILSIGYPLRVQGMLKKRELKEVLHWEKF
ncbi:MAG: nitroreductase family protein [Candidatus Woesearchaeota archaeon]